MSVRVIIVSHKTPKLVQACVRSMAGTIGATPLQVYVEDTSEENIGYAAALDRGMSRDGDEEPLILAMNADTEFPGDGVAVLVALFDTHPDLGLLGPRQVTPRGRIAHAGMPELGDTTGGRWFGQDDTGQGDETLLDVPQVSGSVMMIRRAALEQAGGFRNLPRLYFEDSLLCHRIRKAGWRVCYTGIATFLHHVAASPMTWSDRADLAREARTQFDAEMTG